ncbi:MAG: type II toxin-antitoxin system RelB/DinJ family antitoxin [Firmicutes bacterium]|nr:type II toxin-antitoxin system RelB/DinJ family antitoxin [Bacillota bacterium]
MAQAMVNFRMDEELKNNMEKACKDMGMSMTTAFTIFATKVSKERRIPFDVMADPDPFYSETNMNRLRQAITDARAGKNMTEHELIEVDDD